MARLHTQNSNWKTEAPMPGAPVVNEVRPQNAVGEINVVTKVVADYDPNNVTYARTIVQPIAIVPYNTTEQPLWQYPSQPRFENPSYDGFEEGEEAPQMAKKAGKGVNGIKIFMLILSLLYIALVVVGKFVDLEYLRFDSTRSGLDIIMLILPAFEAEELVIMDILFPALLAASCLFTVIILLASLFSMKKGVGIFTKIMAILAFLTLGGFGYFLFDGGLGFGYGLYAAAGLALLNLVLALVAKRRR